VGTVSDVLVVSADPGITDHLRALGSAAEIPLAVHSGVESVETLWLRASLVVIGADRVAAVAGARLPARDNVVVFGHVTDDLWRAVFDSGAAEVVEPPGPPGWLSERVMRAVPLRPTGAVVGVVGCRGGAGASVLACALAVAGARAGHSPFLLDLDPWSCGLGVVLGADSAPVACWEQVGVGAGRIPASALQSAIGAIDGIRLLGWGDQSGYALTQGITGSVVEAARSLAALTVVDLARTTELWQREALARCDRVLLVVPADVRSVQSARKLAAGRDLSMCEVVVRGPNPGGLSHSDIREALGLPVLAAVGADRGLEQRLERGEPPGWRRRTPLGRAGDGIVAEVLG
jgi:secretion/DNA translocation related CpaE-like protein